MSRRAESARVVLGIGFFFGWLLSFPLYGPFLAGLEALRGGVAASAGKAFTVSHAGALFTLGLWFSRGGISSRAIHVLSRAGLAGSVAATLALCYGPPRLWMYPQVVAGVSAAAYVLWWGPRFRSTIPVSHRGRMMAIGMIVANVFYALAVLALPIAGVHGIALANLALLALALWASEGLTQQPAGVTGRSTAADKGIGARDGVIPWFGVMVLAFCVVGGLYYEVALPYFNQVPFDKSLQALPYIAALGLAGRYADSRGRKPLAVVAVLAMGVSYALAPMVPPLARYFGSLFLINVAFAAFDLFLWVSLADLSDSRDPYWMYGWGLGLNVTGILLGSLLSAWLLPHTGTDIIVACALTAVTALFLATYGLIRVLGAESLRASYPLHQPRLSTPGVSLPPDVAARLTPREREIAQLMLHAVPNSAIEVRLNLAPGTLKTHIAHIYQKLGVNSRQRLTLLALNGEAGRDPACRA
ncbi:MAG: hypothetical protein HPY55_08735 [Firmicutes bacterium]|nr:hypothetical protein [Bacillota bacterium]